MCDCIVFLMMVNCWIYDFDVWFKDGGLFGVYIDGLFIV